jgi:hypothetical protein
VTKHQKRNYDRETAELAGFPEEVSESLLFLSAGGLMRSIFTRATRRAVHFSDSETQAVDKTSPPLK